MCSYQDAGAFTSIPIRSLPLRKKYLEEAAPTIID